MTTTNPRALTLDDIADLRAYERERDDFRRHIIALKKRRRVAVGPFVTLLFENAETIRFQVQEMARVERLATDEAIEGELAAYNPLIPMPGGLSATMFIELTTDEDLREWLPRLVGIERSVEFRLPGDRVVRAIPEASHEEQLTRDDVTASVHYITFELDESERAAFAEGPVVLAIDHDAYRESVELSPEAHAELQQDLSVA